MTNKNDTVETVNRVSSEDLLRQAMQALRCGNLNEAANFAEQARFIDQDAPVLCVFAAISHAVGRDTDALAMLEQAMGLKPMVANYPDAAAAILLKLGRKADGLFNLKLGTHLEKDPLVTELIGDFFGDIKSIFDGFIENRPLETAKIMMKQQMFGAAYRQLEAFISVSGGNSESFRLVAECALQLGQIDAAEIAIKALSALDEKSLYIPDLILSLAVLKGDMASSQTAYNALPQPKDLEQALARFRLLVSAQTLPNINWLTEINQVLSRIPSLEGLTNLEFSAKPEDLRIGFLCNKFTANTEFLLSALNQKVKIKIYCNGVNNTPSKQRLKSSIEDWRDVVEIDDQTLVEMIRSDNVSILFDMIGAAPDQRLAVLRARAAPLQGGLLHEVSFESALVYDFYINSADNPGAVQDKKNIYLEKYLRFPLPPSEYMGRVTELRNEFSQKAARKDGKFQFLVPHSQANITNDSLRVWSDILKKAANSTISFVVPSDLQSEVVHRIVSEMNDEELIARIDLINPEEFARARHLFLMETDIILDSFPRSNMIAVEEALWIGCPVLTLHGSYGFDNIGSTLVRSIGLPMLSARNKEEYIEKAVEWATDGLSFERLQKAVVKARDSLSLVNYDETADNFLEKLREFWREWCKMDT